MIGLMHTSTGFVIGLTSLMAQSYPEGGMLVISSAQPEMSGQEESQGSSSDILASAVRPVTILVYPGTMTIRCYHMVSVSQQPCNHIAHKWR